MILALLFLYDGGSSLNFRTAHYCIKQLDDGQFMIDGDSGRTFPGPVEIIHHHSRFQDGFVTTLTAPCQRPDDVAPLAWPGFTMLELEVELLEEAKKTGVKKVRQQRIVFTTKSVADPDTTSERGEIGRSLPYPRKPLFLLSNVKQNKFILKI